MFSFFLYLNFPALMFCRYIGNLFCNFKEFISSVIGLIYNGFIGFRNMVFKANLFLQTQLFSYDICLADGFIIH